MTEKQPSYTIGDIVEVRFYDVRSMDDWTPVEEARKDKCPRCKKQGHLLEETSEYVIITTAVSEDDDCNYWAIPKGCIISIRQIEEAEVDDFK